MQQYIDFFKSQKETVAKACSPLLNSCRELALEDFQRWGFPVYRSEDYQYTDVSKCLENDFGFYLDYPGSKINPHQVFHCHATNLSPYKHFTVNGHCHEEAFAGLPSGVFSGSLNTFAGQYPDLFTKYYNRQAKTKGNGLTAFNTLFVQDGYVLYIPRNTIMETPVQLTNISGGTIDSLVNRRILVIIEAGAQAQLLVCDHTTDEHPVLAATQVCEIYVEENAVFDFYELEESTPKTIRLANCFVRQAASSRLAVNTISLCNGLTRNEYRIDLEGEHAEIRLCGLAIADNRQKIDNHTLINHHAPACRSNELFKYLLDEEATGAFNGKINVSPCAQKTEAYQNNCNLLGSKTCRMYAKPQLEIYADDVKCSHGMTTGQLDANALFYMRSRGIPEAEAGLLLKSAFAGDVIREIRLAGLRDRLKLLVDKRLRGELVKCQACGY